MYIEIPERRPGRYRAMLVVVKTSFYGITGGPRRGRLFYGKESGRERRAENMKGSRAEGFHISILEPDGPPFNAAFSKLKAYS